MSVGRADELRLFVAVYPPAERATGMARELAGLRLPTHRPVPPGQVHMTLQFVGNVARAELPEIEESVRRAAAGIGPFDLTPLRLITLPERGPARLVALETDTPAPLQELQRRLAQRLARDPRGRERFLPHLTLARFSGSGERGVRVRAEVALAAFWIEGVFLIRSTLHAGGAEHVEVLRVELAGE